MKDKIEQIKKELDSFGVDYEIIRHPPIATVEEGLKYLNIGAEDGVSTLLFKANGKFVVIYRRDDHHLDLKKVKKFLGISNLQIATEQEISEQTGASKGATPMINGLESLMDETILSRKFVYGGTGSFEHDLKIKPQDLLRVTKAKVGDFVEAGSNQRGKKRVFSGTRATGRLHLGNYLGAIKGYLALQDDPSYETIYMVMDLHAITTPYDKEKLAQNTRDVIMDYLACGLDPEKSIISAQSLIPEHTYLAHILSS